jgi:hypothetical protein
MLKDQYSSFIIHPSRSLHMKKWLSGIILAVALFSMSIVAPTYAAGRETAVSTGSRQAVSSSFTGVFTGMAYGDFNSSAPITLELTQVGNRVTGTAVIEDGLTINAGGMCGAFDVPASSASANGNVTARQPRTLTARIPFEIEGFTITADVAGQLSADGEELEVEVKINTPMLCRYDPVINGTLSAVNSVQ